MIGKTVSHYRIVEKIGQGGMGEVFLADDTSLHRKVALKFLPHEMQQDDAAHKRFLREARSAAALDHPFICHINEVAESDGQDFIVMEYVDGHSVKDRLAQGPLPLGDALQISIEVSEALEAAHGKGIIHRDIKPANIMLTQTGHAKVMDFGLAKQLIPVGGIESQQETITALTSEGATVGTLAYMSPEQLRGQAVDGRSDIWALGVTLYEMASGARPFHGQSGVDLTSAILNQAPQPLPSQVPAELGAVIGRCLEKDPGKRYLQAGDLREALSAVQAGTVSPWVAWRYRLIHSRWPVVAAVVLALFVVAGILATLDVGGLRSRMAGRMGIPVRAVRLAVLPFANLTGDPEQDYLSDGLTQEMIAQLGRLHPESLSVIARTSVMRYKKTEKAIDEIGRELGVGYILEGSARRDAGRIRIAAELIQVRDQTQLWAETYEREMAGILGLQAEVARKVAETLALKLLPAEQARLANVRTVNPEAYDAYLKGSQLWPKMTKADVDKAQQYFELALAKDPKYALAYVGMAWVWIVRNQMGMLPPSEALPQMKAAAQKAEELDPSLGEAHYTLACIRGGQETDWASAEPEWRQAIELSPNLSDARGFYSLYLMIMKRPEEAMAQIQRALELDPISTLVKIQYALDLQYMHRYDDAIEQLRMAVRAEPENEAGTNLLWFALALKGMDKEAFAMAKNYIKSVYGNPKVEEAFDRGFTEGGYKGGMRQAAEALVAGLREAYVSPADIADLYLGAGETAQALNWLEKCVEAHDPTMQYLGLPWYDPLRSEPRFQALMRKMNLPS